MTERGLRDLFAVWQQRLGLARWSISVRVGLCSQPFWLMQIDRAPDYERAVVTVSSWVLSGDIPEGALEYEITPEMVERCVVHELLHCYTGPLRSVVDDLDGMLHPDAHHLAVAALERVEEANVDRLACALVAAWPQ